MTQTYAQNTVSFWKKAATSIDETFKYWAILPTVFILVVFTIFPIGQLLWMSVSELEFSQGRLVSTFVGLKHLSSAIQDAVVPIAWKNTFIFVFFSVACEVLLGLALALLISRTRFLVGFYRTILLFPLLIPPIAIGTIWSLMYDYNYGFINQLLALINVMGPIWTADPKLALTCIIFVDIWHWTSFLFLIILAGVESLPHELAEASRVDGASEWQTYRYIFLPLLKPTLITAIMLRTIFAFKVFDQIFLLTGGGPGTTTEVINLYIYKTFFEQFRLGYGAFLALSMGIVMSILVIIFQIIKRRRTE
ncbi:MAG: sugar ABC transporter permease [bacterium]|nr:sugar ABC transporter permease [bacterium]